MQEVLPQPPEAIQDHMDGHVQEAAQEGTQSLPFLTILKFVCFLRFDAMILDFLCVCYVGFCSRSCEEEAPCHQEALFEVHCWCHFGGDPEAED